MEIYKNNYFKLLIDYNDLIDYIDKDIDSIKVINVTSIPQHFKSLDSLKEWLKQNHVDKMTYVKETHDCDDFAVELQQAALSDGYLMNIVYDPDGYYRNKNGEAHMLNSTIIGNYMYIIEPQNDKIVAYVGLDYDFRNNSIISTHRK